MLIIDASNDSSDLNKDKLQNKKEIDDSETTTGAEAREVFKDRIEKEEKEEKDGNDTKADKENDDPESTPLISGDKDKPTTSWDILGG